MLDGPAFRRSRRIPEYIHHIFVAGYQCHVTFAASYPQSVRYFYRAAILFISNKIIYLGVYLWHAVHSSSHSFTLSRPGVKGYFSYNLIKSMPYMNGTEVADVDAKKTVKQLCNIRVIREERGVMRKLAFLMAVGMVLMFGSYAFAAPTVDVVQAPTNYFVPDDSSKGSSPYYRWWNQDWSWTHNAIAGSYSSAVLQISAYDVDWSNDSSGEWDIIWAKNNSGTWVELGHLDGNNNIWAYTNFTLDLSVFGLAISNGLEVKIDIDSTHNYNYWAVSLAKSTLSLDGGQGPGPEPGPVPEPTTLLLLGLGVLGLAGCRKRD